MWEGQIEKGEPKGFVRYIEAFENYSFVGYSIGFKNYYGTILEFEKQKLTKSGTYGSAGTATEISTGKQVSMNNFKWKIFNEFSDK